MTERIRHEYFYAPHEQVNLEDDSWFYRYGRSAHSAVFSQPNLQFSRYLLADMLTKAWNSSGFFSENGHMIPQPDESDRMLLIAWLQQAASMTGLLNGEEIRMIQRSEGLVLMESFKPKEVTPISFKRLSHVTKQWHEEGLKIGLFHGSFDPPTIAHLGCATEAYTQCDRLLIGFDNDDLLRLRKGASRPRYRLMDRRKIFGSFWMVDGTFALRASDVEDDDQYIADYQAMHVDYVFLSNKQEEYKKRVAKIRQAGAEPKILKHRGDEFNATLMLEQAQIWGFIK